MASKKFYRNSRNKVIGGVCSGLADYFNLDVALLRVLFVVAFLFASFGFWLYIILWIVIPVDGRQSAFSDQQSAFSGQQPESESIVNTQKSKVSAVFAGILVILIGILFLINNFIPISWVWKLWPLILVGIGVVMIYKASKKGDDNE